MGENHNTSKFYFLIGLGCGVVGTLLLAPRLKEVREEIAGAAFLVASKFGNEIKEEISGRSYEAVRELTSEIAETGQKIAATFIEETKERLIKSSERLSEAINVGKQSYMEEKARRKMAA
ncbi:MAG: hypothetical protein ACRENF_06045 [Thermodesulfobacteriota bacterium]